MFCSVLPSAKLDSKPFFEASRSTGELLSLLSSPPSVNANDASFEEQISPENMDDIKPTTTIKPVTSSVVSGDKK